MDESSIHRIVNDFRPNEIYNLGAMGHVGVSFKTPKSTLTYNTLSTFNILETIKNIKLLVSAPFHSSLMNKATNIMKNELNKLNFIEGKNKLISNVTAKKISNTNELKDLLVKQIENRVRWRESVINMINNDVNHFIEIGPGKVLSGLVKELTRK